MIFQRNVKKSPQNPIFIWKSGVGSQTFICSDDLSWRFTIYSVIILKIDLRFKSVSGRGYEIKILFAGLHIADVSVKFYKPHILFFIDIFRFFSKITFYLKANSVLH